MNTKHPATTRKSIALPFIGLMAALSFMLVISACTCRMKDTGARFDQHPILTPEPLPIPASMDHWHAHYDRITDKMMREAADIMVESGMADVGYRYVNMDTVYRIQKNIS